MGVPGSGGSNLVLLSPHAVDCRRAQEGDLRLRRSGTRHRHGIALHGARRRIVASGMLCAGETVRSGWRPSPGRSGLRRCSRTGLAASALDPSAARVVNCSLFGSLVFAILAWLFKVPPQSARQQETRTGDSWGSSHLPGRRTRVPPDTFMISLWHYIAEGGQFARHSASWNPRPPAPGAQVICEPEPPQLKRGDPRQVNGVG